MANVQRFMRLLKLFVAFVLLLAGRQTATAQHVSLSIGTDVPYQHYLGATLETNRVDVAYRSGLLIPPYSDVILDVLLVFGTDEIYTKLIDEAYDFGWMNSLGSHYKIGPKRRWYIGAEYRVDYLTAAETAASLVDAVVDQPLPNLGVSNRELEIGLQVLLHGVGTRMGRTIQLGSTEKHRIRVEFSFHKHISSKSTTTINSIVNETLNREMDDLLWEDVFKPYGFAGGLGVSYCYRF